DNLLDQAARTNTALELNANPQRFDLTTEWLQKAASKGIPIAVNTDAHNTQSLHFMNYGYRRANRAWLQKQDIINTWSKEKLLIMNERTLNVLEFDKVISLLIEETATAVGLNKAKKIEPSVSYEEVEELQAETDQAMHVLRLDKHVPFTHMVDVTDSLKRCEI